MTVSPCQNRKGHSKTNWRHWFENGYEGNSFFYTDRKGTYCSLWISILFLANSNFSPLNWILQKSMQGEFVREIIVQEFAKVSFFFFFYQH